MPQERVIERKDRKKFLIVLLLAIGMTIAIYATHASQPFFRVFLQALYFLPLILAAFWFGLRGSVATSISITVLYLPFILIHWGEFNPDDFERLLEVLIYNIVAALLGFLRDRDRKQQKRLAEAESLAAIGRAVSSVAHDLKTPLVAIGGFSRLVLKQMAGGDPAREKLEVVLQETERMENMVKEMLEYSSAPRLRLAGEDCAELVSESIALVSETARVKNVRLETLVPEGLPSLECDGRRIKEMLINLLSNAIDASPEREAVTVRVRQNAGMVMIDVSDLGSGIDPERRQEVFEPFFTTKEEGTGLGLAIVKKIVDAHAGRIEILGEPAGTTFRVYLPLAPREQKG